MEQETYDLVEPPTDLHKLEMIEIKVTEIDERYIFETTKKKRQNSDKMKQINTKHVKFDERRYSKK